MYITILFMVLFYSMILAQYSNSSIKYESDSELSTELATIVNELALVWDFDVGEDGIEQISLAVIDLNKEHPILIGVNANNFIYPASVYKMYVAAEVLSQISQGK